MIESKTELEGLPQNLRPLADRVLLRELPREDKVGSIIIPETAGPQGATRRALIIALGPGKLTEDGKLIEPRVYKEQKVIFGKYSGTEITMGGHKLIVCREEDLMAVIEE